MLFEVSYRLVNEGGDGGKSPPGNDGFLEGGFEGKRGGWGGLGGARPPTSSMNHKQPKNMEQTNRRHIRQAKRKHITHAGGDGAGGITTPLGTSLNIMGSPTGHMNKMWSVKYHTD